MMEGCPHCRDGYSDGQLIACASEDEDCAWAAERRDQGDEHRVMRAAIGMLWAELHEHGSIEAIGVPSRSAMRISEAFQRLVDRYEVPRPSNVPDDSVWARYGPSERPPAYGPRLVR